MRQDAAIGYAIWIVYDQKGTSKNAFFPRLLRQRRTRILIYAMYTAVLRAALPCTHGKNAVFRGAQKGLQS